VVLVSTAWYLSHIELGSFLSSCHGLIIMITGRMASGGGERWAFESFKTKNSYFCDQDHDHDDRGKPSNTSRHSQHPFFVDALSLCEDTRCVRCAGVGMAVEDDASLCVLENVHTPAIHLTQPSTRRTNRPLTHLSTRARMCQGSQGHMGS
jgi:hypothetical protein